MYNNNLQTKPRKWEAKPLFTIHYQLLTIRAFTLIELLVVMTIMVMLVAISVPMLKPMFESQKTKNAAQTVAAALQRVRFKAMEDQATYGIEFMPFETNNNVALQMRLVKQANNYLNPENVRVRVVNNNLIFCVFDAGEWKANDPPTQVPSPSALAILNAAKAEWDLNVTPGYKIQFDRQGRWYELIDTNNTILDYPGTLNLPEAPSLNAMEYKVIQSPRHALTPPVVLPRGTVVDLAFSEGYEGTTSVPFNKTIFQPDGIKIMFTPNGDVDYFYGNYNRFYGGLIYFCIGEWDRQLTDQSYPPNPTSTLAEDGNNNIQTMTNFWVTLHPRTGAVRITEMAPITSSSLDWTDPADKKTMEKEARKFAAEHFGISE